MHQSLDDQLAAVSWDQQPDAETLLAVMSEERKVRDAALAGPRG